MKLLQETDAAPHDRKLIKSQVEKRRRERMNRSLERLRTMLLEEPQQQGGSQHRVEKAEILEHTVLFLQKSAEGEKAKAGDGSQKHSFQDGFSSCLQRAAQFLGPEGKDLWLGPALDATFARLSSTDPEDFQKMKGASSSLPHTKSLLRRLRLKSKHRPQGHANGTKASPHPYRLSHHQVYPRVPQQPQTQNQLRVESQSQRVLVNHALWRPWP